MNPYAQQKILHKSDMMNSVIGLCRVKNSPVNVREVGII